MDNDLIGENGIILIDNTLWRGEMYPTPHGERGQLFYDFNEFVQNDPRVSQVKHHSLMSVNPMQVKKLFMKF